MVQKRLNKKERAIKAIEELFEEEIKEMVEIRQIKRATEKKKRIIKEIREINTKIKKLSPYDKGIRSINKFYKLGEEQLEEFNRYREREEYDKSGRIMTEMRRTINQREEVIKELYLKMNR